MIGGGFPPAAGRLAVLAAVPTTLGASSGSSGGGGGYQALGPGECLGRALFPFRGTEVCPGATSALFEAWIANVEAGISRAKRS
jgi:hypothetical protein